MKVGTQGNNPSHRSCIQCTKTTSKIWLSLLASPAPTTVESPANLASMRFNHPSYVSPNLFWNSVEDSRVIPAEMPRALGQNCRASNLSIARGFCSSPRYNLKPIPLRRRGPVKYGRGRGCVKTPPIRGQ